jgi:extradiol dioxygenase family protein
MQFKSLIPELTVSDIDNTKRFYIGVLSFKLEYERQEDGFIFLSLGGNQMMFEQYHEDGWNTGNLEYPFGRGVNFEMTVDNVDELYRRVVNAKITPYRELTVNKYKMNGQEVTQKEFLVQDPDGYLLRFTDY